MPVDPIKLCAQPLRSRAALAIFLVALSPVIWAKSKKTPPPPPQVTIDASIPIVESAQETGPVNRATQDLLSDFNKVFGQAPKLTNQIDPASALSILIAQNSRIPTGVECATATDREAFAFSIATLAGKAKPKHQVICLTGSDMRGTIFAIYHFSQVVLGTDPMYLWTDKQPEKRSSITLPADFAKIFPKPVFKYRGFFPNDEDLLTGWMVPDKGDQTGISLKVWDNIFETTLRLKGNMIVPGTWIFPDDAQIDAASKRGLIINQHHAIPLGVNVARWPKDVPYNYSTHPEIIRRAWTNSVATYKPDAEILWSVGLRGLSDSSYASMDPTMVGNDPLFGQKIGQAIDEQMQIVRARFPNAEFVTDLWQEGARLMQAGYLKIPPEVALVWADTGYGDMQDGGKVAAGQGAYFHVAMMNGQANQLSELVPVAIIHSEIGRYIKAGATAYLLINTSDIRPVAMTTRAVMELAWSGLPTETNDSDTAYYKRWATEEFGVKSANELAGIYKDYFAASPLRTGFGPPGFVRPAGFVPPPQFSKIPRQQGDNHYQSEIRRVLLDKLAQHQVFSVPSQSPKWSLPGLMPTAPAEARQAAIKRDIEESESAQPRWDAVWNRAVAAKDLVDPGRRDYYQAEVLTMITINRESNRALGLVARSLEDADAGQNDKAISEADDAVRSVEAIQQSMAAAEYGKWKNWYRGDWLSGVYRTHEVVQDYANHLKDPMAKLPAPVSWSGWEAYFHIMQYEGDRSVDVH